MKEYKLKEDYDIKQGDITDGFDAGDIKQVKTFLLGLDAVISAGPFAVNKNIVKKTINIHIFCLIYCCIFDNIFYLNMINFLFQMNS